MAVKVLFSNILLTIYVNQDFKITSWIRLKIEYIHHIIQRRVNLSKLYVLQSSFVITTSGTAWVEEKLHGERRMF